MNQSLTPHQRATLLANAMNLSQKLMMMHGPLSGPTVECPEKYGPLCNYTGNVYPQPQLSIPQLKLNDGPQGFRDLSVGAPWSASFGTTAFPSSITAAATFDRALIHEWGLAIGEEFYHKGANVWLGPGLNLNRFPRGGRNFEYGSGEDPHVGYHFGYHVSRAVQSKGVIATAKHFVDNNQELDRTTVSENVMVQAQHELYYPPFAGAVAGGAGAVMCSYNRGYGKYSCAHPEYIDTELKGRLGFTGFVMTDWGAGETPLDGMSADMEMPGAYYYAPGGYAGQ